MNHNDAWALLEEYLDGSLPAAARWAVTAHLDECQVCRKQVARDARLRGVVRDRLAAVEPSPGLNARLRAALATEAGPAPRPTPLSWSPSFALRFATLVGPALVALWLLARVTAPVAVSASDMAADLAMTHALFAHDETLFDVAGDAAAVTAWFHAKAGLAVATPALPDFEVAGGRLVTVDGKPVAQVIYEAEPEGTYVSLLHLPDRHPEVTREPGSRSFTVDHEGPTTVVMWQNGEGRWALVAALPETELRPLAETIAAQTGTAPAAGQPLRWEMALLAPRDEQAGAIYRAWLTLAAPETFCCTLGFPM